MAYNGPILNDVNKYTVSDVIAFATNHNIEVMDLRSDASF